MRAAAGLPLGRRRPVMTADSLSAWRRITLRVLVAVLAFMVGFPILYAALVPDHLPPPPALPDPPPGNYRLFVVDWGYHAAIVVEQPRGWRLGPPGAEESPFLEYAWGDRSFYYESNHRPHAVFGTLFLPTASVLYLEPRPDPPHFGGAEAVFARTVDAATLRALLTELERSIEHDASGARLPPLAPTPLDRGRFYAAHGKYLWTRNCNWWVVARLAGAGLASRPTGVIFTTQVGPRLREFTSVRP